MSSTVKWHHIPETFFHAKSIRLIQFDCLDDFENRNIKLPLLMCRRRCRTARACCTHGERASQRYNYKIRNIRSIQQSKTAHETKKKSNYVSVLVLVFSFARSLAHTFAVFYCVIFFFFHTIYRGSILAYMILYVNMCVCNRTCEHQLNRQTKESFDQWHSSSHYSSFYCDE